MGASEGKILRVLTRANPTVVGTFHYGIAAQLRDADRREGDEGDHHPEGDGVAVGEGSQGARSDSRAQGPVGIARDDIRDDRDRVYGKEAHRREWDDLEGVVVDVEITSWPSPAENPNGRVVEILGYEDDFGVDVEIVIRKHHLPHHFPVEVLQEAEQFERTIACERAGTSAGLPRAADRHHRRRNGARFRRCRDRAAAVERQFRTASTHRRCGALRARGFADRSRSAAARHVGVLPRPRHPHAADGALDRSCAACVRR